MNQLYAEAGVKRKDSALTMALRALLIVGMIAGVLIMMLGSFFTIIGVVIAVIMFLLFPMLKVEYEYVFVDGQIDFDRILGNARRKTMLRIDMEQTDIVAPEGSHALDSYTNIQLEKKDFSSGDATKKPYIIIVNSNDKKLRIAFEPSEKMLTMMRQKSPRKVSLE